MKTKKALPSQTTHKKTADANTAISKNRKWI